MGTGDDSVCWEWGGVIPWGGVQGWGQEGATQRVGVKYNAGGKGCHSCEIHYWVCVGMDGS